MIAIFELYLCIFCNKNAWHVHKPTIREPLPTQFSSNLRGSLVPDQLTQRGWESVRIRVCVHSEAGKGVETLLISQKRPLIKEEGEQEGGRWLYCWRDTCRVMQLERTDEYLYTCRKNITKSYSTWVYQQGFFFWPGPLELIHILIIFKKIFKYIFQGKLFFFYRNYIHKFLRSRTTLFKAWTNLALS